MSLNNEVKLCNQNLLDHSWIQKSTSAHLSSMETQVFTPVCPVLRMNCKIGLDFHPLPFIQDLLDKLWGRLVVLSTQAGQCLAPWLTSRHLLASPQGCMTGSPSHLALPMSPRRKVSSQTLETWR